MPTNSRRVVIITALPIERTAVLEHLRNIGEEPSLRGSIYRRGLFDDRSDPWDVILAEIGAGNEASAAEAERVISHYAPEVALFIGVAGAIKDLKHGDVVASTKVYNYGAGKDRKTHFETRPDIELPGYPLLARARHEAGEPGWRDRIRAGDQVSEMHAPPEARVGPIAAGPKVLASNRTETYRFIRDHYGDAIAVEMEGHGFLLGVRMNHPTQGIVVRGISDRINDKTPASDDDWQPVAARRAAAFAFQILAKLPNEEERAIHQLSAGALAQQVRIGDVAGESITLNINQHHGPVTQVIGGDSFDGNAEIDLAAERIRQGEPDIAFLQLSDLRKRRWDKLTPRERYRLVANLGHAEERRGNLREAARCYFEAKGYQPEDEKARSLEAVGYFLLGENSNACELATAVLAEHPTSSIASAVRIRCAPETIPFTDLEKFVPAALREDVAILHALGWRAANAGDMAAAERLARAGLRLSPDSIEFQEQLGAIIVQAEANVRRDGMAAPSASRLEEAVCALSSALSKAKGQENIARLRHTRAAAYDLLDRADLAETDYRAACENGRDDTGIPFQFAVFLERRGRHDDAIDVVRRISKDDGPYQPRLLLANLLAHRNRPGDHTEATGILEAAVSATASADVETRTGLVAMLVQLYGVLAKHKEALRILDSLPPGYLSDAVRLTLRADTFGRSGLKDDARAFAIQAMGALGPNSHEGDKLRVAQSLYFLREYRDALSIWKPLLTATRDEPFEEALDCAKNTEDDEFIIRYCQQLRSNGIYQPFILELEVVTLARYSCFDEAIALMQEYLRSPADEDLARVFRVRLSLIGLRQGRPDLVESDAEKLPPPGKKPVAVGCATACVLKHGPRPEEGVKYAYELVRQHFSEPRAREVYVTMMGIGDEMVVSFADPKTACPGSAVHYRIEDSAEEKWVIIEDSPDPKQERGEIAADHVLAQEMSGKGIGETFFYRRDPIQDRTATILAVVNKYTYRKFEILESWEDRFPGVMFVRKYTFAKKEDGSPDIQLLLRALDQREQQREQLHDLYRKHPLSLTTFARISRTSLLESLVHLASDDTLSVRCCLGNNEERQRDEHVLREAETLVIDPTALATLFFSNHYHSLGLLPVKLVVCDSSLQQYRDFGERLATESSGFFGKLKGQYVFRDDNPGDRQQQQQKVANFLTEVQSAVTMTSGQSLIDFDPEARQELIEMFGRPAAEAIAAATKKDTVLWSDDLGVAEVARERVGTHRVWTQLVFGVLKEIPSDVYTDMTLFLLQWSYNFTRVEPDTILAACRRGSWEPESPPLRDVVKWLGAAELNHLGAAQVCVKVLPLVWMHGPLIHQRENVTRALIRAIRGRQDGRRTVISIRNNINDIFGLDVVNVDLCAHVIDGVLHEETVRGLILPDSSG